MGISMNSFLEPAAMPLDTKAGSSGKRRQRRAGRPKGPMTPLTRAQIVQSALKLLDRDGLAALSMRKLGAELGVDPMAVYYYVPSKEALLDAIVEAVMAEIDLSIVKPEDSAEERIMCAARAYRDVMLAHVNALPILLTRGPATPVAMRPVELLIGVLRGAGLQPGQAMAGMNTIAAAVRGVVGMAASHRAEPPARERTAQDLPPEEFPFLLEAIQCAGDFFERDFEFGIRAMAHGLLALAESQALAR
jgi:AcrR family transcriptional regulator